MSDTNGNGVVRTIKKVPVAVWTFLFTQLIAIIIFAVRLDNRVTVLEGIQPIQNVKLESVEKRMEIGAQAIIRTEERLNSVIERLGRSPQQR